MTTDTQNRIGRSDNNNVWMVMAVTAAAIIAYAAYVDYRKGSEQTGGASSMTADSTQASE